MPIEGGGSMIYEAFDAMASTISTVWTWAGSANPHHSLVAGIVIWFLIERVLGFIATPIFKAASITAALILALLITGAAQNFGNWTDAGGSRPAVARGAAESELLKEMNK